MRVRARPPASTRSASASASGSRSSRTTRPASRPRSSASRATAASSCRSTSGSTPTRSRYIVEHSGASMLLVDPELDDALADVTRRHRFVIGEETDDALLRYDREPEPWIRRRRRDRHDQLHERHHRPTEGRAAHAPQPLDERDDVRLADRRERPRRLPVDAADVPLQRLGHGRTRSPGWVAATSSCARSTAPRSCGASSEHGVTFLCGAPAVVSRDPRPLRETPDGQIPGATGAHGRRRARRRRRRRSSASRPSSVGVHPDLRPHRDRRRC